MRRSLTITGEKMASRKGIEPLTPGLGNLCSILLSYRDCALAHSTGRRNGRGSAALALLALLAPAPAAACGTGGQSAVLKDMSPAGDLALDPGGGARLAGLALDESGLAALRGHIGQTFAVATLAPGADRWGRRAVDLIAPDGRSLTLGLLENGLALVRDEADTRGCEAERMEAEQGARLAGEGLWARPGAILDAGDLAALAAQDGRFVLVRGRVKRTGVTASRLYIDFEPARGLSVVVPRKLEAQFRRGGRDVIDLAGRMVLVRGVLDNRFGPRIEIADPAMIEPLENAKESSRGG